MAVTKRELELLDQRAVLQQRANDWQQGTVTSRSIAQRQLDALNAKIVGPAKKPVKQIPKVVGQPAEQPTATLEKMPAITYDTQPPVDPVAPTMDDAARDTAAATPLDPAAAALGQPPKRKKYGIATSTLTGETGLGGSIGNIASKVLLG